MSPISGFMSYSKSNSDLKSLDVLVVEGNQSFGNLLSSMLRTVGVREIELVGNAENAVLKLREKPADLIISELSLPNMSGSDLLNLVRSGEHDIDEEMPFIMVTDDSRKKSVISAVQFGVDAYLVKPLTASLLESRLQDMVLGRRPAFYRWRINRNRAKNASRDQGKRKMKKVIDLSQTGATGAPSQLELSQKVRTEAPTALDLSQKVQPKAQTALDLSQILQTDAPSKTELNQNMQVEAPHRKRSQGAVQTEAPHKEDDNNSDDSDLVYL